MKITGLLGDSCPNGVDCDRTHDTDDPDYVLVQGQDLVTDPQVRAEAGTPDHEHLLRVKRTALHPPQLAPAEVGVWIFGRFTEEVLRIEGLKHYTAASDSAEGKAAWQAQLDTFRAATPPRTWRVLRLLRGEPSAYELAELDTYDEHVDHGEDVRVFAVPPGEEAELEGVPDFFLIDRKHVIRSLYDADGRHLGGQVVTGADAAVYRGLALSLYARGVDLRAWRLADPEVRRGLAA